MSQSEEETPNPEPPEHNGRAVEDSVVNDIITRRTNGEFPEVLPSETLTASDIDNGVEDVLAWGKKIEHVLIQSYMNERYREYREAGQVLGEPEPLIRAKWAREHYYFHLSKFWESQQSDGSVITETFSKLVPLNEMPDSEAGAVRKALMEIGEPSWQNLIIYFDKEWNKMWSSLPIYAQVSEEAMRRKWGKINAMKLIHDFQSSQDNFEFIPELSLDSIPTSEDRDRAAAIVKRVKAQHVSVIEREVEEAYTNETTSIPLYLRENMGPVLRNNFIVARYFDIVEKVLNQDENTAKAFSFVPALPAQEMPDEDSKSRALDLIKAVREEHVNPIANQVAAELATSMQSLPVFTQGDEEVKHGWMKENYYRIVADIVLPSRNDTSICATGPTTFSTGSPTKSSAPQKRRCAWSAMLESPQKRSVRANGDQKCEVKTEPTYITVGSICQSNSRSDSHVLQAYVLYWPEQPRFVSVRERRGQSVDQVAVTTCILADRDGPVLVDFWRDLATSTIDCFNMWSETKDSDGNQDPVLVNLKYFNIRSENRKCLLPLRKLVTSERTTVSSVEKGTQESVTCMEGKLPMEALYTRDLSTLEQEPPFLVCVAGVIGVCEAPTVTRSGKALRAFDLHDMNGKCAQCTALGRHADNACIERGNEVILYFAQGQASTMLYQPGQLSIYDDSHIVLLRPGRVVPNASGYIEFHTKVRT